MWDKVAFIDEYFRHRTNDIKRAAELLDSQRYHLEGMLILSCHLGSFAAMRYPCLDDGQAYVKVVREYSGMREFFDRIDLHFLYQWPESKLSKCGSYKGLKNHAEIAEVLTRAYAAEDEAKSGTRYVSLPDVIGTVLKAAIPGFDEQNFRCKIPLFSYAEILYRYVRCDAVHYVDFPLLSGKLDLEDESVTYEPNHGITPQKVLEATRGVCAALWKECRDKNKWPHEL